MDLFTAVNTAAASTGSTLSEADIQRIAHEAARLMHGEAPEDSPA
jgi:hypothetical protein